MSAERLEQLRRRRDQAVRDQAVAQANLAKVEADLAAAESELLELVGVDHVSQLPGAVDLMRQEYEETLDRLEKML